jgi:hypothetical protein
MCDLLTDVRARQELRRRRARGVREIAVRGTGQQAWNEAQGADNRESPGGAWRFDVSDRLTDTITEDRLQGRRWAA